MAEVKFHIWEGKMVHAVYSDVVDAALTEPVALADILKDIEKAPAVAELRVLRTSCKEIIAGENAGKYAVRAVLRYVPEAESESL